jgi:hypothetical protein
MDKVTMMENIEKVRVALLSGETTIRREIVRRHAEMHDLNMQRPGMNTSQVRKYNETINFILKEIHLLRLLEAGKL